MQTEIFLKDPVYKYDTWLKPLFADMNFGGVLFTTAYTSFE